MISLKKLERKNFDNKLRRFDAILDCDRQTDRHHLTANTTLKHSIAQVT